ncbi:MAG: hypothetical protein AAF292_12985 [Pseudomonadota bacterium]
MHDLRGDLETLWRAAGRLTLARGGRSIMFISATSGEGTSSVAASFALMTADRARRSTWLVELNLTQNRTYEAFRQGFASDIGRPGRAFDASLGVPPIYDIRTRDRITRRPRPKLLAVHQIEGTRLLVTRFRKDRLFPDEKVRLSTRADWWQALRRSADWIIADAPALDTSGAGLAMASQMDRVVLVVEADRTRPGDVIALRREVEDHGGQVLGVVMNRMALDARMADRLAS